MTKSLKKLKEDLESNNFIRRNFRETDEEFRKRVIEESKRKYIKEKYFILNSHDPLNYRFKNEKHFVLNPFNLEKIIDIIIKILETETKERCVNWEKYI